MCRGRIFILRLLLVTTYSTSALDLAPNKPENSTISRNETKPDSTITWIKISPLTTNSSSTTESTLKNTNITENISGENQNIDFAGSLRRKRRKRRRNKYKTWNQRRSEHSHKKHSTKVEITKPVQFLTPPDYQENLIPKETSYYKSRIDVVEKSPVRTEKKKITPPSRHLLPPLVDTRFINTSTQVSVQQEPPKKSKHIDWSPNSTNRGSTKFKHTVYYSDSGNEIISNYEITSTTPTPKPQIKFTTKDDTRAFTTSRAVTEIQRNYNKLENRPIVVQPTSAQYHTTAVPLHNHTIGFPNRETRINSLLSFEVANAGMQIINMTNFQKQNSPPSFHNQFVPNNNYKQIEQPLAVSRSPNSQQSTAHPINYQQSQDRATQQINHQQWVNYQQSQLPDQISYQQPQPQQVSNYQQSQPLDHYQQTPSTEQIPQQINYQQSLSQQQNKAVQTEQSRLPQPRINHQQSQPQQSNYQPYQQTQLPPPGAVSNTQNFQQIEHSQPYQTYNQQSLQNYQSQTTYRAQIEQRSTTPIPDLTINRTTSLQKDNIDNFKGLDLAESKYFSDIPSEQEFNALQNDGQVIPGIAGKDYPVFDQFLLQKRRFHCRGLEGYFADVTSRCQVFYICNGDGAGEPMLCPNGTLFSQELLVCDWWYNVDC